MEYHFLHLCRICLKEDGPMFMLFDPANADLYQVPLLTKIVECCHIQVLQDDGFPQQVCLHCVNHINVAYDLKEVSACSDAKLRKYLEYSSSNFIETNKSSLSDCAEIAEKIDEPFTKQVDEPVIFVKKKTGNNPKKKKKGCEQTKSYPCADCGKEFQYKCLLKEHQVLHTGHRRFLCSICGKSFAHQSSLSSHIRTHSDEKRYQCDICAQRFRRPSHLTFHRRTHTGEKPFSCEKCGREFAQSSYLKEHMRLHSGEKPFVCEDCGHSFARRSCLVMHQRTHTGELPFPCPECDRSFSQRSQRKRHVKKKHMESLSLGKNGELLLREHDKLRELWTKMKDDKSINNSSISAILCNQ